MIVRSLKYEYSTGVVFLIGIKEAEESRKKQKVV